MLPARGAAQQLLQRAPTQERSADAAVLLLVRKNADGLRGLAQPHLRSTAAGGAMSQSGHRHARQPTDDHKTPVHICQQRAHHTHPAPGVPAAASAEGPHLVSQDAVAALAPVDDVPFQGHALVVAQLAAVAEVGHCARKEVGVVVR